jgi:ADP-ribosyl-[dinitrogen reductase] hydrolase
MVLKAANLGEDADTTAAICGQLAGAHYGASGIPERWLRLLVQWDQISQLAEQLMQLSVHLSSKPTAAHGRQ